MVGGDEGAVDATYVKYEITQSLMGGIQRKVVMRAPKETEVSEYQFKVLGYVENEEKASGVQNIVVKIKSASSKFVESKYPPIF